MSVTLAITLAEHLNRCSQMTVWIYEHTNQPVPTTVQIADWFSYMAGETDEVPA